MKELLAYWIIVQLVIYGLVGVDMTNRLNDGTYECITDHERISFWWGVAIPLTAWLGENSPELNAKVENFCVPKP